MNRGYEEKIIENLMVITLFSTAQLSFYFSRNVERSVKLKFSVTEVDPGSINNI